MIKRQPKFSAYPYQQFVGNTRHSASRGIIVVSEIFEGSIGNFSCGCAPLYQETALAVTSSGNVGREGSRCPIVIPLYRRLSCISLPHGPSNRLCDQESCMTVTEIKPALTGVQ